MLRFPAVRCTDSFYFSGFAAEGSEPTTPIASAGTVKVMSVSGSGKRGRYVRQVTGRHNDTDLHVAARVGDVAAVRRALGEAAAAEEGAEELEAARRAVAAEPNQAGETPLVAATERGHLEVVVELLRHLDDEAVAVKNRSGYDALHVATREGHLGEMPSFKSYFL
jgi:ankyrin repeat protein